MESESITHVAINLGPTPGSNDAVASVRIVPTGREGEMVFARTLNFGEVDAGEGIVRFPGERLVIPLGDAKFSIQDIDRHNTPDVYGFAPAANTIWSWLNIPPLTSETLFNLLYASALRLDSAHSLCVRAIEECDDRPDEPFIQARSRIYRALGHADLMCVALHRAIRIMKKIPQVKEPWPKELDQIESPLCAIRDSFEHIEERAVGEVKRTRDPDAMSIFKQPDFLNAAVLSYSNHLLDLKKQVIPALIAGRGFLLNTTVEKTGKSKTVNVPLTWEWGTVETSDSTKEDSDGQGGL